MTTRNKVYCINCIHLSITKLCIHPDNIRYKHTPLERETYIKSPISKRNAKNNCKDYKEKTNG